MKLNRLIAALIASSVLGCGDDGPWYEGTWQAQSVSGVRIPATVESIRFDVLTITIKGEQGSENSVIGGRSCPAGFHAIAVADTIIPVIDLQTTDRTCLYWGTKLVRVSDDRATTTWLGRDVVMRKK